MLKTHFLPSKETCEDKMSGEEMPKSKRISMHWMQNYAIQLLHSGHETHFECLGCIQKSQSEHFGPRTRHVSRCYARPWMAVGVRKEHRSARWQPIEALLCCPIQLPSATSPAQSLHQGQGISAEEAPFFCPVLLGNPIWMHQLL